MSVPLAYIGLVLIWSTTPLAIKWSSDQVGFLFGVSGRMALGLVASLLLIAIWRKQLPRDRAALHAYIAAGVPLFFAMTCVYWGAQFLPSGLISVIFGLTPVVTGVIAITLIGEASFTPLKVLAMALGISGLGVIFQHSFSFGPMAHWGVLGVLGAVFFHSLGTVWMKKVGAQIPAMTVTTGGLLVATSLFVASWLLFDRSFPTSIPQHTAISIVYLALVGSVLGAILFYYALKHLDTGKIAMLTLITPVTALFIGNVANGEAIDANTVIGASLVLSGLVSYQTQSYLHRRKTAQLAPK